MDYLKKTSPLLLIQIYRIKTTVDQGWINRSDFYFAQANNTYGRITPMEELLKERIRCGGAGTLISTRASTRILWQTPEGGLSARRSSLTSNFNTEPVKLQRGQLTDIHTETAAESEPETTDQPPKNPIDLQTTYQHLQNSVTNLTELELKLNNKLLENKNIDSSQNLKRFARVRMLWKLFMKPTKSFQISSKVNIQM